MRWLAVAGALTLSAALAPGAAAQRELSEQEARRTVPHYDAMKAAATRGREMYLYDQAAWHATDRFREQFDLENASFMRGYIVLPRDDGRLDTVFYGEVDGALVEVARYTVAESRVEDGGLLPENARPPLSDVAVRMANARQAAFEEMREREYGLCGSAAPNTVILPPSEDGTITVYVLTPPTENDSYPMGGHYRIEVAADGKASNARRFMNTCFPANFGESAGGEGGARPIMMTLTHLLDPQPTEIHIFASYYVPIGLMIITTENERIWSIDRDRVGYMGKLDELANRRD
jgi:hypothetical protein